MGCCAHVTVFDFFCRVICIKDYAIFDVVEARGTRTAQLDRDTLWEKLQFNDGCYPQRRFEPPNAPGRAAGGDLDLEERFMLLMRQPPHRNRSQITNVRPRTIYTLVRAGLRLGDPEWLLDVIRR